MQLDMQNQKKKIMLRVLIVSAGIIINTFLNFIMYSLGMPLYLDTVGTVYITVLAGPFFGILTAVITNAICMTFNSQAIYFSSVNALVAICTFSFVRRNSMKKAKETVKFILMLSVVSGFLSMIIQLLLKATESTMEGRWAHDFSDIVGIPFLLALLAVNLLINTMDKTVSAGAALLALKVTPEYAISGIEESTLKQSRSSYEEISKSRLKNDNLKGTVRARETISLIAVSALIVLAMSWIGLGLYFSNEKKSETRNAYNAARFAAEVIDKSRIDEYVREGEDAKGYKETKEILTKIRDNASGVTYLYVVVMKTDGCLVVFDLDTETKKGHKPGEVVPYEESVIPYRDKLIAGEEIDPIESDSISGWVQNAFYPIRDDDGKTICYVGCGVSLEYMAGYMRDFIIKVLLMLAGMLILLIAYELWSTSVYTTYPISTMTAVVDKFSEGGDDQQSLDENVRTIRALKIHTGDEIEKLYQTLCDMTLNQAEQMRNIRRLSDSTMKMQDGLILTMADMVESRDSDTGEHVQKTAAYVKIIVEGLKKKGYYAEKITPKFISDVVRSAPLHDVGKINISDRILNKPGKLTDEEFEIMKTHTTAGKEIMEKAISTVKGGNYLKEARNMAAYHHERWDGKGYPEGLHGEVIPLSARIMAVADVFDALTSPRVYKAAFPLEKSLEILREGAGTQFDPKCVEVFMESISEVKVILNKYNQL